MKKRKDPPAHTEVELAARACSPMMRAFAQHLLTDPRRNASKAARAAGYKAPRERGQQLTKDPNVRRYMELLLQEAKQVTPPATKDVDLAIIATVREAALEVKETLERISEHARVDMADFISVRLTPELGGDSLPHPSLLHANLYFDWQKAAALGKTHLIKKIKWNQYGPEIELVDSQSALRTMAQVHGLLNEPEKTSDPAKMAAAITALATLPSETLRQVHRALLSQGSVVNVAATSVGGNGAH